MQREMAMDPVRNPFAPGAGTRPPELTGREETLKTASVAMQRTLQDRPASSMLFLGLRGVGKTVLLNTLEDEARQQDFLTSFFEAQEGRTLQDLLFPRLNQLLRKLSLGESAKHSLHKAWGALKSFAKTFKLEYQDISISVDPDTGVSDSGNLEYDLSELFERIGEAAKDSGRAWALFIDEIQYLDPAGLSALIVAMHRINQRRLPILIFGAGLPQVAALSGDAKSYAERLFQFHALGVLDDTASRAAIQRPIEDEGESISDAALDEIVHQTQGYPYFLQEWGYQAWNHAQASPITRDDVILATKRAVERLDDGFFKVRMDRLTPKERDYVLAMARLGEGPYRSSDVAKALGQKVQALGPLRAKIIAKGMIYSPDHGDIAFTVPMFADYLRRNWL